MKYKIYPIVVLIIFFSSLLFSQEDTTDASSNPTLDKKNKSESRGCCSQHYDDSDEYGNDYDDDFEFDFISKRNRPSISLSYGLTDLKRKDLSTKGLVNPLSFEIKLGTIKQKNIYEKDDLVKESFGYFLLSNYTSYLKDKKSSVSDINSDTWKFGFGNQTGYGYKLSESFLIIPYTESSLNWSRINFAYDSSTTSVNDIKILEMYDDSFRFGNSSSGGLKIQMLDNIALDFSYERQIIFQRVLFWKWAGSSIIEAASQGLLDKFIDRIFESSPYAAPIVSFVLKNALSYGMYELRQEKMNWPFKSEAPMSFDQFKIGLTFIF